MNLDTLLAFPAVGGGLNVQGGHVYVDFGNMPTDKFEQILKSIRVPIWLTANKTWYVRTDGSDSNDGSANDAAHAFRTIQAALNYISSNFNLGPYKAIIRVAAGEYDGFTLPKYTASTGSITIEGSGAETCSISATDSPGIVRNSLSAGRFFINDISFRLIVSVPNPPSKNIANITQGCSVAFARCNFIDTEIVAATNGSSIIFAFGGEVELNEGCTMQANGLESGSKLYALNSNVNGRIAISGNITINGRCTAVVVCSAGANLARSLPTYIVSGVVTGRRYSVNLNGIINTSGGGANYFPGTVDGTTATGGQYL